MKCPKCQSLNTVPAQDKTSCQDCNHVFETYPCKKLPELTPVVSEGQITVVCPNCKHYYHGQCANPTRHAATDACPFDDKTLPVRPVDANGE